MRNLRQTQLETPTVGGVTILVKFSERHITLGKELFHAPNGYTCDESKAMRGQIKTQNSEASSQNVPKNNNTVTSL